MKSECLQIFVVLWWLKAIQNGFCDITRCLSRWTEAVIIISYYQLIIATIILIGFQSTAAVFNQVVRYGNIGTTVVEEISL